MSKLVPPHGSDSVQPLLVPEAEREQLIEQAKSLTQIPLTTREASDVFMFGMGAYTPLTGFMGKDSWHGVCVDMKLDNGVFWPIPVTLSAKRETADTIAIGDEVALCDGESGDVLALLTVEEKYEIDKALECEKVYRTTDPEHPGVQKVLAQEDVNLGGSVRVVSEGEYPSKSPDLYLRPLESRALFEQKGWSKVAAFQTRNPMHRSHEHLVKIAVEVTDGVFIHQVLGALKPGYF